MNTNYKQDLKTLLNWLFAIILIPLIIFAANLVIENYRNYMLKSSITFLESKNFKIDKIEIKRLDPEKYPCLFTKYHNSNVLNDFEVYFIATDSQDKRVEGYVCGYSFFIFKKIHILSI